MNRHSPFKKQMLALPAKCDKEFITMLAILSFFSFCKWGVRSSTATTAEMLPSRSRNRAFSSGMTNWSGTGPPRDLRTTTEFKLTLTEPLILELENEKYDLQSTMRQRPHSFRMIFLRFRPSMLETFMLTCRGEIWRTCFSMCVFQGCRLPTKPWALRVSLHFLRGDSVGLVFIRTGPPATDVTNHIWTRRRGSAPTFFRLNSLLLTRDRGRYSTFKSSVRRGISGHFIVLTVFHDLYNRVNVTFEVARAMVCVLLWAQH